jgi:hypothetical protein
MNIVVWNLNGIITVLDDKNIAQKFAVAPSLASWLTTFALTRTRGGTLLLGEPRSGSLPTEDVLNSRSSGPNSPAPDTVNP